MDAIIVYASYIVPLVARVVEEELKNQPKRGELSKLAKAPNRGGGNSVRNRRNGGLHQVPRSRNQSVGKKTPFRPARWPFHGVGCGRGRAQFG